MHPTHPLIFVIVLSFVGNSFTEGRLVAEDWPMYRKDTGRTAVCKSDIPRDLSLAWSRQLPPLEPAFHHGRLQFDAGYEPVCAGDKVLIASSRTDSVTTYNVETGERVWTYRTNGPVRCAPAIWKDRVCFGSDDGHLYCVHLRTGDLQWKRQAAPSDRRLLGNQRLISVWPVRGGPVVDAGRVYFAAGVWPFEGVFVYALEIATGEVIWRNDRMGYLFGQQPHNTQAIGGLVPQGYLLIDHDELIVPCSTAYPARLDLRTGELIDFKLPSPGRLPGGWFSQVDPDTAKAVRRGSIVFDDVVNRQQHEDKEHVASGGVSGLSRQIQTGATQWKFDDGFQNLPGKIHSLIVANNRVFVVTREGTLSCFVPRGDEETIAKRWPLSNKERECVPQAIARAKELVSLAGTDRGYAVVIGIDRGNLVHALVQHTNYNVVALDDNLDRVNKLRRELEEVEVAGTRAAVIACDLSTLELPPYVATVITSERPGAILTSPHSSLRPFGGIAALGSLSRQPHLPGNTSPKRNRPNHSRQSDVVQPSSRPEIAPSGEESVSKQSVRGESIESKWIEAFEPGTFKSERIHGERVVRRIGPLPGSKRYPGDWKTSEDTLVRFPLGVLWFDDTLSHFKRSPQPKFTDGVMISRPKAWRGGRTGGDSQLDYSLLPTEISDIYTGRVLHRSEKNKLRESLPKNDPSKLEPVQYRPPRQTDDWNPKSPVVGERVNPLTGLAEPRAFPKTYGCDGGVDYGLLYTLRCGTPAYYDKTLESGTVFLSGPRSGCTNSIIPSGGVLNVPYFYEGCTCSYPLPSGMSLVSMPERFEQWSSWGEMEIEPRSIERIGLNFGAPGDRVTREGTLWLDWPSVGGPSPEIEVVQTPADLVHRYHHSMWMSEEDPKPWVTASMVEGMKSMVIHDMKPGTYRVRLYFAEPDEIETGDRIQNISVQGIVMQKEFDILGTSKSKMKGVVLEYHAVEIKDAFTLKLEPLAGKTLVSGIELKRD